MSYLSESQGIQYLQSPKCKKDSHDFYEKEKGNALWKTAVIKLKEGRE